MDNHESHHPYMNNHESHHFQMNNHESHHPYMINHESHHPYVYNNDSHHPNMKYHYSQKLIGQITLIRTTMSHAMIVMNNHDSKNCSVKSRLYEQLLVTPSLYEPP